MRVYPVLPVRMADRDETSRKAASASGSGGMSGNEQLSE
ncbi:hypothetical protein GGE65_007244 [Skermanella aerolata]